MFHPRVDQKWLCCLHFAFFYWGGAVRFIGGSSLVRRVILKPWLCGIFMVNIPSWENQYGRVTLERNSELFGTPHTEINSIILNG